MVAAQDGDAGRARIDGCYGEGVLKIPCEDSRSSQLSSGYIGTRPRCSLEVLAMGWLPLCPNFEGSDDAPATANRGEAKKVFSAASISASRFWPLVVGIYTV